MVTRTAESTRRAILTAATGAFAEAGFDAARVDAIAARAGVNKALIYYHFYSKQGLYAEILRAAFRMASSRTAQIAASRLDPAAKIEAFIDALDQMAERHPHVPHIMMREMAAGARRIDPPTLRLMAAIFGNLRRILDQGVDTGTLAPADPTLTYFTLIAPVIFFRATTPIRDALARAGLLAARPDAGAFVDNLKRTARAALAPIAATGRPGRRAASGTPAPVSAPPPRPTLRARQGPAGGRPRSTANRGSHR